MTLYFRLNQRVQHLYRLDFPDSQASHHTYCRDCDEVRTYRTRAAAEAARDRHDADHAAGRITPCPTRPRRSPGRPWTATDDDIVRTATSHADAADILGRSVAAIQTRAKRLGITKRPDPAATTAVTEQAWEMLLDGIDPQGVIDRLGISSGRALDARLRRRGLKHPAVARLATQERKAREAAAA